MTPIYDLIDKMNEPNFPFDEPNAMDDWAKYGFIKKDVFDGDTVKVTAVESVENTKAKLLCDNGISLYCDLKKDKEFFALNGICPPQVDDIKEWLVTEDAKEWFKNNDCSVMIQKNERDVSGSFLQSHITTKCEDFFDQIKKSDKFYNAQIIGKNNGGFIVNVEGVIAFLPGGQAAANKIQDFDSYIGKTTPVMIDDYIKNGSTFIVSHKKYLQKILPSKIQALDTTKLYQGTITGNVAFGLFVEFDEIYTGLLHMSEMDMTTNDKFKNREYKQGTTIDFYIKEISKDGKVILTKFENRENVKEYTFEDFQKNYERTTQSGEIINIKENLGVFVRFVAEDKQFIGLLYFKEVSNYDDYVIGAHKNFYISKVVPEAKKIFLKNPIVYMQ